MDPRIPYFYKTWYRIPFLIPAWDREEEVRTILASTLTGMNGRHRPDARETLKALLWERFGFSQVVLTSTGRFAIEIALRSLNRTGGEVVIPTFICRSVADAVLEAGYVPVFADVNEDLTLSVASVRRNLTPKTVAVLVAHLSGKPASDLRALVSLCQERGLVLIDDAAQAFGVKSDGAYLGSFGEFGILSFGVGKPTFSVGGGALILRSAAAASHCESILRHIGTGDEFYRHELATSWNCLLQYRWRRVTLPAYLAGRALRRMLRIAAHKPARGQISKLAAVLQVMQVRKLDDILTRFLTHGQYLVRRLSNHPGMTFPQRSDDCGYTKLIAALQHADPHALAIHLLKQGVEIEWSYTPLDLRPEFAAFRRHQNAQAERIWSRLLALPVHPGLHEEQLEAVAGAIERFIHAN